MDRIHFHLPCGFSEAKVGRRRKEKSESGFEILEWEIWEIVCIERLDSAAADLMRLRWMRGWWKYRETIIDDLGTVLIYVANLVKRYA